MRILFLHQSFPGPFRHLVACLGARPEMEVVFLSEHSRRESQLPGVRHLTLPVMPAPTLADRVEREAVHLLRCGSRFANALLKLKAQDFEPDIVYEHPRRGCGFFVSDIFPEAFHVTHAEWYFTKGENFTFFSRERTRPAVEFAQNRIRNLAQLNALTDCHAAVTTTEWQKNQYPEWARGRIHVMPEGVDTDFFSPCYGDSFCVDGCDLSAVTELVTFSGRGVEPFRGFPQFYAALPRLLAARPECHVVIMAAERAGNAQEQEEFERLRSETPLDPRRVHFVGFRPYEEYRQLLRASSAHVYFTAPFALSSGLFEAMSCGCLLVGSDTAPVREVLRHGENGFLCDFWEHDLLADILTELLARKELMYSVRDAARKTMLEHHDLKVQLPVHINWLLSAYERWKINTARNF